MNLKFYC